MGFVARYRPEGTLDTLGASNNGASFAAIDAGPTGGWLVAATHDGHMTLGFTLPSTAAIPDISFADPHPNARDTVQLPDGKVLIVVVG